MDIDWAYETMRTRLIVRIDLAQYGWRRIGQLNITLLGCNEDDEGLDPFFAEYCIERSGAQPLKLDWMCNPSREQLDAFLKRHTNPWVSEWRQRAEAVYRDDITPDRASTMSWQLLNQPNLSMLQGLLRMQGAVEAFVPTPDQVEQNGSASFALQGLRRRLEGLISNRMKIFADFQDFLRGLDGTDSADT